MTISGHTGSYHSVTLTGPPLSPPRHDGTFLTDGEQWCRIELARLADDRWGPQGWRRFLRSAFTRAEVNRRGRHAASVQARWWAAGGAGAWLLISRWRPDSPFGRAGRGGLWWWAGCAAMLDWHLGMLETEAGDATGLHAADALTLLRAWLVPAVAAAPTPGLLLLGGLTDVADGRVARATRCTRLGRDLEGTVDACFSVAALHGALATRSVSASSVRLEQLRLAAGFAYIAGAYFGNGAAPDRTLVRSARGATPVRFAALIAAGVGRRRLADGLLLVSTAVATRALVASR